MGNAVRKSTKVLTNFNLENRVEKVLNKTKPVPAPKHKATVDYNLDDEEVKKVFEKSDKLVKNMETIGIKSYTVKDSILPPGKEDPRHPPYTEYGFIVPDEIPRGKVKMKRAIEMVHKYQTGKATFEELSITYELPLKTVLWRPILTPMLGNSRFFCLGTRLPRDVVDLYNRYKLQTLVEFKEITNSINDVNLSANKDIPANKWYQLKPIADILEQLLNIENAKQENEKLFHTLNMDSKEDVEMGKLLELEMSKFQHDINKLEEDLLNILVPKTVADKSTTLQLELIAGAGGVEAGLFSNDLLNMYQTMCLSKGWELSVLDLKLMQNLKTLSKGDKHGDTKSAISHCVLNIDATGTPEENSLFSIMKFEAGVHRVQRIPLTSKLNKIHTSTVAVTVLPGNEDVDIQINENDLKWEVFRASGAGGQHVNTTDSAVRLTHIPSNIVVSCQRERSLLINKRVALKNLQEKLLQGKLKEVNENIHGIRKTQIGTLERSEKIRTYNYQQDRITDHRLAKSWSGITRFIKHGALFQVMQNLYENERTQKLIHFLKNNVQ